MQTLDKLPDDLLPHEHRLHNVGRRGLELFHQRFSDKRVGMSKRTEASSIHDCWEEIAREEFDGSEWQHKRNLFDHKIGVYRIRIKLMDRKFLTRNYPTQMVMDFLRSIPARLFDWEPTINLTLGYQRDGLVIPNWPIFLTRQDGAQSVNWVYHLLPPASSSASPIPAPEPLPAPKTGRVKAKPITRDMPIVTDSEDKE